MSTEAAPAGERPRESPATAEGTAAEAPQTKVDAGSSDEPARLSLRSELAWLAPWLIAVFVSLAWFVEAPAWNQNSRLALTRAIVERGTLTIDDDHPTTGDKSFKDGHFYCDKAPGVSLLAVPAHAIHVAVRRGLGLEEPRWIVRPLDPFDSLTDRTPPADELAPGDTLQYAPSWRAALWVCNVASNVTASVLAFVACFVVMRLQTSGTTTHATSGETSHAATHTSRATALIVASISLFATPSFPYATAFYGHQAAASGLFLGWALLHVTPHVAELVAFQGRTRVVAGACLGLAVACEYTTAVPVVFVCLWAALRAGVRVWWPLALGGAPFAALLAAYHTAAFGHPLTTGYAFVWLPEFAEGMAVNYGLGAPRVDVLLALLVGEYRGLLTAAPVLLFAVWGLGLGCVAREPGTTRGLRRSDAILAIGIVAYATLLNAGYYMWDGGSALGPRHAVMALPFASIGLYAAFERMPVAVVIVAMLSALQMLAVAAVGVELPRHGAPVWDHALPLFFEGATTSAQDLGQWLGLPRPWSALVLLGVWMLAAWAGREAPRPRVAGRA